MSCKLVCKKMFIFAIYCVRYMRNAQNQQQEDQAMREINEIYPEYEHQEEYEVPKLSDLCSNVIHAHIQRPVTADKLKQLPLPKSMVHLLRREDVVKSSV